MLREFFRYTVGECIEKCDFCAIINQTINKHLRIEIMIIKDIKYKLKDGRNALIRSPQDEDIKGMLELSLYFSR